MNIRGDRKFRILFFAWFVAVYIGALIVNGFLVYDEEKERLYESVDQNLKSAAYSAAAMLGDGFHDIALTPQSVTPEEDRRNTFLLSKLTEHSDIIYVYTLIERNGTLYFTSSSSTLEEQQQNDVFHYFDSYDEATDADIAIFENKKILYEEGSDRWGTFRSVLIPMYSTSGNLYVTGADVEIGYIEEKLGEKVTYSLVSTLFFVLMLLPLSYFVLRSYRSETRELKKEVGRRTEALNRSYEQEHGQRMVLELMADIHELIISAKEPRSLLDGVCEKLGYFDHYQLAWAGMVEEGRCEIIAHSGEKSDYLDAEYEVVMDPHSPLSKGPAGKSILLNQTVIIENVHTDPDFAPWRERAERCGFVAVIGLPLKANINAEPFGTLQIYTDRKEGFDAKEVLLLQELSLTIGFAIHSLRSIRQAAELAQSQIKNYEQTVFSLVDMIEQRDSYTAGHSTRVSNYCVMIAEKMGLDAEEVRKIKLAAVLHDVGKLATPDAILLKPAKLTDLEYQLIKEHVSVGYELFRSVDMYKELAPIIHAHHERYDGSGYPQGLKGDEIPLLSCIMAVADSFDAMTTNRIYKPRVERQDALNELQELAGTAYRADVVEAAVEVLQTVDLNALQTTQLPTTELERERFAYFFKDNLSSAYNKWYLDVVLHENCYHLRYRYAYILKMRNFTHYNRSFGWEAGDEKLKAIAAHLQASAAEGEVFRIYGDHFIVLCEQACPELLSAQLLDGLLGGTPVHVEGYCVPLSEGDVVSVQHLFTHDDNDTKG